ncbi:MAG: hypothetical protein ACPGJS_21700 [Flammeovirgaceae bacterium]
MTYREFRSGKRKLRYKIIKDQRATNRYEQDQSNAVIVLPDFEAAQHEDILHTSLEELGQQLNIDSFSVYQDDAALAFNSKSNELTEEEQRQFRESFIGVYPGRRRS